PAWRRPAWDAAWYRSSCAECCGRGGGGMRRSETPTARRPRRMTDRRLAGGGAPATAADAALAQLFLEGGGRELHHGDGVVDAEQLDLAMEPFRDAGRKLDEDIVFFRHRGLPPRPRGRVKELFSLLKAMMATGGATACRRAGRTISLNVFYQCASRREAPRAHV